LFDRLKTSTGARELDAPGLSAAYRPLVALIAAAIALFGSMAVCAAAIVVPAPAGAVPVVVALCAGCPLLAGSEFRVLLASRRRAARAAEALGNLRAALARLPETEHPLGL
jgi:hypothetical protein